MNPDDLPESILDAINRAAEAVRQLHLQIGDPECRASGTVDDFRDVLMDELLVPIANAVRQLTTLHTTANRVAELYSAQYIRANGGGGRVAHAMKQMSEALASVSGAHSAISLPVLRPITTKLRRLSPETLSECSKVSEFSKLRESVEAPANSPTEDR